VEHPWTDALSILPLPHPSIIPDTFRYPYQNNEKISGALEKDTAYAMQRDFSPLQRIAN